MANKTFLFRNLHLLDIRLWFQIVAFLHLFITAIVTLSIDPSVDEDVRVKAYKHLRWKLLTCWYNMYVFADHNNLAECEEALQQAGMIVPSSEMITLAYLPLCVYLSFKEKRGLGYVHHVQRLRNVTDIMMTGIIFPITMSGGILFWVLMSIDVNLIAPPKLFDYMPYWCQHSLHSISIVVVILDLQLTPRTRPKSLVPRFLLATSFIATYTLVVYISYINGEPVYNFFEIISTFQTVMLTLFSYVLYFSFYFIQWKIIDFRWSPKKLRSKFKQPILQKLIISSLFNLDECC